MRNIIELHPPPSSRGLSRTTPDLVLFFTRLQIMSVRRQVYSSSDEIDRPTESDIRICD